MTEKIYKFKNVKHSVLLKFVKEIENGDDKIWQMENKDYKGLMYFVWPSEMEEVK